MRWLNIFLHVDGRRVIRDTVWLAWYLICIPELSRPRHYSQNYTYDGETTSHAVDPVHIYAVIGRAAFDP